MGEHADDILDGSCCQYCGDWFHDGVPPGHPRTCGCDAGHERRSKTAHQRERLKRRKKRLQDRKKGRLSIALNTSLTTGWERKSEHHFQRTVNGHLVNWWPSAMKYQVGGTVRTMADNKEITIILLELSK